MLNVPLDLPAVCFQGEADKLIYTFCVKKFFIVCKCLTKIPALCGHIGMVGRVTE